MAKGNVRIQYNPYNSIPTITKQTAASATAIYAGEPVKLSAAGAVDVIQLADNEPVIGTTTQVIGITQSDSTHTATAVGTVEVNQPLPGIIYACKATTAANFDTVAEIMALENDRVLFDLTSTTFTVDENAGDTAISGLQIVGGDPLTQEVYFIIRPAAVEGPVA
jgi:hypothetical protein